MTKNEAQDKAFSRFQWKHTNSQVFNNNNKTGMGKGKEKRRNEIYNLTLLEQHNKHYYYNSLNIATKNDINCYLAFLEFEFTKRKFLNVKNGVNITIYYCFMKQIDSKFFILDS